MGDQPVRSGKISGTLYDLRLIARHLVKIPPWTPLLSILGPPSSWRSNKHSEFNLTRWSVSKLSPETRTPGWPRTLENLVQASAAIFTPRVFPFRAVPSSFPFRGTLGALPEEGESTFRNEKWFFVNGIATNSTMLQMNGAYLYELFRRPIELINNPTDGIVIDLIESLFGRTFDFSSTPALYTRLRVEDALLSEGYDRVVLLAHSQGAIVASNVVRDLVEAVRSKSRTYDLRKLEVYTFGSAADEIDADDDLSRSHNRLVPYIEHFANREDLIAKMGILQKENPANQKEMDGQIYTVDKSGHLFNAHYLPDIAQKGYINKERGTRSRLYGYLGGKTPDYYNPVLLEDID